MERYHCRVHVMRVVPSIFIDTLKAPPQQTQGVPFFESPALTNAYSLLPLLPNFMVGCGDYADIIIGIFGAIATNTRSLMTYRCFHRARKGMKDMRVNCMSYFREVDRRGENSRRRRPVRYRSNFPPTVIIIRVTSFHTRAVGYSHRCWRVRPERIKRIGGIASPVVHYTNAFSPIPFFL